MTEEKGRETEGGGSEFNHLFYAKLRQINNEIICLCDYIFQN